MRDQMISPLPVSHLVLAVALWAALGAWLLLSGRRPRPGVPTIPRWVIAVLWAAAAAPLALLMTGCGARLVEGRDYWIDQRQRIIYTRSEQVATNLCAAWGAPRSRACTRYSDGAIIMPRGTTLGDSTWNHEMKHRRDGAWHP